MRRVAIAVVGAGLGTPFGVLLGGCGDLECDAANHPMTSGAYANTGSEVLEVDVSARTVVHTYSLNGTAVRSEYSMGADTTSPE